jgi:hypothetical protein
LQRLLAQTTPVAQPAPQPTAPAAPTSTPTATGKPTLKFPDPPLFEGDPVKLDGWLTQTQMYLRAYDVDLSTVRAVDVATMFLRGKAQDWWTGQFHLQESGTVPILASWSAFVQALTAAFLPVELARRYIDQLLHVSQGKQDMRSYIDVFNSLSGQKFLQLFLRRRCAICFCRVAGQIYSATSRFSTQRRWLNISSML